jgi:hypothetical protein
MGWGQSLMFTQWAHVRGAQAQTALKGQQPAQIHCTTPQNTHRWVAALQGACHDQHTLYGTQAVVVVLLLGQLLAGQAVQPRHLARQGHRSVEALCKQHDLRDEAVVWDHHRHRSEDNLLRGGGTNDRHDILRNHTPAKSTQMLQPIQPDTDADADADMLTRHTNTHLEVVWQLGAAKVARVHGNHHMVLLEGNAATLKHGLLQPLQACLAKGKQLLGDDRQNLSHGSNHNQERERSRACMLPIGK